MRGNADYELAAVSHPYARPAVKLFVERLSAQYRSACGEKLVVTSLTRPVQQQPRNASDLSVHPAGMAVDMRISRKRSCVRWLEKTLLSLEKQGVLDVTRERRPPHYHVALFPQPYTRYVASIAGRSAVQLASAQPKPAAQPPASTAGSSPVAAVEASAVQASAAEASLDDAADLERELEVALDSKDAAGPQLVTANVTPDATDEVGTYRVNRGDSLWSIARRHNTTVDTLKDMNSLKDSYIMAGQIITVPVVASGADES
jgi:LysM repeat protein